MAGAKPAAEAATRIAGALSERNTAEMGAHADNDEPFRLLYALIVPCGIQEIGGVIAAGRANLSIRAMVDEDRLGTPNHG